MKRNCETVPQSSSIYGQDPYAPPFNRCMIAQQNKGFSDCCPQVWITGLVQAQQARDGLFLETQILSHSQTWGGKTQSVHLKKGQIRNSLAHLLELCYTQVHIQVF